MNHDASGGACGPFGGRTADAPLRWSDRGVALALSVVYLVILAATLDIGYTRDESYYFKYSQVYMDWFTALGQDVEEGEWGRTLRREPVVRAWSNNFEHPPLMKTLFGWSWALFAQKIRPLGGFRVPGEGETTVQVNHLGRSDGFQTGARVLLLPPRPLEATADRGAALPGVVIDRSDRRATVRVEAPTETARAFSAACAATDKPLAPLVQRPCAAVEDRSLGLLSEGSATRLPALLFAAALIGLIYLFGVRLGGRWVGLFAALSYAALPRGFFHAHLAAFDVPVVTTMLVTLYGFWRAQWSGGWAVATGVLWGIALLTKHNAFFLPITLVLYWLIADREELGLPRARRSQRWWPAVVGLAAVVVVCVVSFGVVGVFVALLAGPIVFGRQLRLPRLPSAFLWMPAIGLPLLFLLWPKLWYDPFRAFRDYVSFHLSHEHYMQYYFGKILEVPPFPVAFPFVVTILTVPIMTLGAFFGGVGVVYGPAVVEGLRGIGGRVRALRRHVADGLGESGTPDPKARRYARRVRTFVALNLILPIGLIALPRTPIFGGVKHWLTAMPFFAIVAGFGFDALRRFVTRGLRLGRPVARGVAGAALLVLVLMPAVRETVRAHPFGTAYYNGLVGGVQGANSARLQRQFWGYATRQTFPWLNAHAPRGARVFFQNTTYDAFTIYRRDGDLRSDLRYAWGPDKADIALFEHQKSFAELEMTVWQELGTLGPANEAVLEGVPMISVYVAPGLLTSSPAVPRPSPPPSG